MFARDDSKRCLLGGRGASREFQLQGPGERKGLCQEGVGAADDPEISGVEGKWETIWDKAVPDRVREPANERGIGDHRGLQPAETEEYFGLETGNSDYREHGRSWLGGLRVFWIEEHRRMVGLGRRG